ncbi:hypothetical protein JYG34_06670 [Pseudomonas entomophila]|uniref:DUF6881 domain-containing protein n=1 Tax=Pseudomonas entomophila TaxID=312306 RepID=UPI001BCAB061|nr:hypothetical protein [Pseudomonas entomophila]QVM92707.1 hypothetical protein JYG34_06670 [Pseudomonas entomophila]
MRFLKVKWNHAHLDEPHLIYQEVDNESWEVRKVELFGDGTLCGYASKSGEFGDSILSDQKIPSIDEINESEEFYAEIITQGEFERIWVWAMNASGLHN